MNHVPLLRTASLLLAIAAAVPAQQFPAGAVYLMSPVLELPPNQWYPGIRRVDPFTGQTQPFVQFTSNFNSQCSAAYDPFRDRIVALCAFGAMANVVVHAFDASGFSTGVLSTQSLHRLTPRGDGKIYCYKAGAPNPILQQIFYLDARNQEQVLQDVGGTQPWLLNGGAVVNALDPIRAMIYEPSDNSLFLALQGEGVTPSCGGGAPTFDVQVRKLPLNGSGTALRAPAVCTSYDVAGVANVHEAPFGFSYGPNGQLVLAVYGNTSGAMPRLLRVDPVTAQLAPFATVGPYFGDLAITCGAYCPTTGRCLVLDAFNDVFRTFGPGEAGSGTVIAPYGPQGVGGAADTLFVVGPIGPTPSLTASTGGVSVGSGGAVTFHFHPGPTFANDLYLIAGSLSGWSPGIALGNVVLPINLDAYTDLTLSLANSPFLVNTIGVLPPSGSITAQLVMPPGVLSVLAGLTMHHAALAADNTTTFTHASNPVPLVLLP